MPPPEDANTEFSVLIAALGETDQKLEDLTAGQVDAVADRQGRTFLLRHAQDQMRQGEAARQSAILNALPAHIAVLDSRGRIISVNTAWRQFGRGNGLLGPEDGIGLSYLDVCDSARGAHSSEGLPVAAGIRSVLRGEARRFSLEYSCHSPTEQRWFLLTATPLGEDQPSGAVVMHLNITERKRSEENQRAMRQLLDNIVENIPTAVQLKSVQEDFRIRMWNKAAESMYGLSSRDAIGRTVHELWPSTDADHMRAADLDLVAKGGMQDFPDRLVPTIGRGTIHAHMRKVVLRDPAGRATHLLITADDISERLKRTEEQERFVAAMDATADAIYLVDRSSMKFVHVNDAACRMREQTREDLLALGPMHINSLPREALEQLYDDLIASDGTAKPLEIQRKRKDGTQAWFEVRRNAQRSGDRWTIITLVRDVTDRKAAQDRVVQLSRMHAVLSGINSLIVRVRDKDELFRDACRIAVDAGGFRMAWIGLVDPSATKLVLVASAGVETALQSTIQTGLSLRDPAKHGGKVAARIIQDKESVVLNDLPENARLGFGRMHVAYGVFSIAMLPLIVADKSVGVIALCAAVTDFFHDEELALLQELAGDIAFGMDHIDKQDRINYLAYYDVLTGLANRSLFLERVAQYMRSAVGGGYKMALFLIDLERFKNINDSLGQPAGDTLLQQVADWLRRNVGDANLLARIGADHFAIVLPEVRPDGDVGRLLEKQMDAFQAHPFRLNDAVFRIAFKGGIAIAPGDGDDAATLFRNAEAALKKAKGRGERYLFYTHKMTETVAVKLTLENQLRRALEKEEFALHYQPKVHLVGGKITGAEALIRWNDPATGLVPPGKFIPILEETGLIYEVGRWALGKAIGDYLRCSKAGLAAVPTAVNVSPLQLRHRGFVAEIERAISVDPRAAAGLELEITESLIMEDIKNSIASLKAIRDMGVRVAIDDFGTGFSSLSYLSRLPVDTLKIDRSFVVDMTAGPQGLALVATIIDLAHALNLKVVAEGVETEEQSRLLRLLNCDEMQGFLFSKPLPADVFEAKYLTPPSGGPDVRRT